LAKNISDIIEEHLKEILENSPSGMIELQRSELAEVFQCVPSQINYVISTRFSIDHGYIVESKRGGGGYIRIRRIELDRAKPLILLAQRIGARLSQRESEGIIERLLREELITHREAAILRAVLHRDVIQVDLPQRDEIRARMLVQALIHLSAAMMQFTES